MSKAIDKAAGAEREVMAEGDPVKRMIPGADQNKVGWIKNNGRVFTPQETKAATVAAARWDGWGTALKPAHEPICLARKPLSEETVAANVLRWGTGAINVDECRIGAGGDRLGGGRISSVTDGWDRPWKHNEEARQATVERGRESVQKAERLGRWPANVALGHHPECVLRGTKRVKSTSPAGGAQARRVLRVIGDPVETVEDWACHPECPVRLLDEQSGVSQGHFDTATENGPGDTSQRYGSIRLNRGDRGYDDTGGASRFFYCSKADSAERGEFNRHPTLKPVALMRWLCRLATPPGGMILDPFMGSGSTGVAALAEGFRFVGVEREAEYFAVARRRIAKAAAGSTEVSRGAPPAAEEAQVDLFAEEPR